MQNIGFGMLLGAYGTGVINTYSGDVVKGTVVAMGAAFIVFIWAQMRAARRKRDSLDD